MTSRRIKVKQPSLSFSLSRSLSLSLSLCEIIATQEITLSSALQTKDPTNYDNRTTNATGGLSISYWPNFYP